MRYPFKRVVFAGWRRSSAGLWPINRASILALGCRLLPGMHGFRDVKADRCCEHSTCTYPLEDMIIRKWELMADFFDYPFEFDAEAVRAFLSSAQVDTAVLDITPCESAVSPLRVAILNCDILDPFHADNWLKVSAPSGQKLFRVGNVELSSNLQILNHEGDGFFNQCFPGYLPGLLDSEHFQRAKREFSGDGAMKIERAFLLNHGHDHIYGHFLTEIFPKIIMADMAYRMGFCIPVILGNQSPAYCEDLFRLILPHVEVIRVPPAGMQIAQCFLPSHPALYLMNKAQLHAFDRAMAASRSAESDRLRLLVRRSQIKNSYRQIENWADIENLAKYYGFTIFTPGDHPFDVQIDHFMRADIIVGEYSSALHNSLFAGPSQVISLNWINHVQQAICYSRKQPLTIIMPEDGTAVTAPTVAYEGPVPYRVKLSSLKNAIDDAIRNIIPA